MKTKYKLYSDSETHSKEFKASTTIAEMCGSTKRAILLPERTIIVWDYMRKYYRLSGTTFEFSVTRVHK